MVARDPPKVKVVSSSPTFVVFFGDKIPIRNKFLSFLNALLHDTP
jgi:hypothetical protein